MPRRIAIMCGGDWKNNGNLIMTQNFISYMHKKVKGISFLIFESLIEEPARDTFNTVLSGLGADIVNIVDETSPDFFWSTCYRARAEFIRLKNRQKAKLIVSDPCYNWELVAERSKETERRTKKAISDAKRAGIRGGAMGAATGAISH